MDEASAYFGPGGLLWVWWKSLLMPGLTDSLRVFGVDVRHAVPGEEAVMMGIYHRFGLILAMSSEVLGSFGAGGGADGCTR
jgi:hypothetical protein